MAIGRLKKIILSTIILTSLACYISGTYLPTVEISTPQTITLESEVPLEQKVNDTIKICSFNIENMGQSKIIQPNYLDPADDPDPIVEAVDRTLMFIIRSCDITAIQEISDKAQKVMPYFLDEVINALPPSSYAYLLSNRIGQNRSSQTAEQYAFIYNTETVMPVMDSNGPIAFIYDEKQKYDYFAREPFIGYFKAVHGNFDFFLVTIHASQAGDSEIIEMTAMENVVKYIKQLYPGEGDIIPLGDTNLKKGFTQMISSLWTTGNFTSIIGEDTSLAKSVSLYDQIIIDWNYTSEDFTNSSGVIRFDELYNLSVPASEVSDHYPVYGIFNISKDTD